MPASLSSSATNVASSVVVPIASPDGASSELILVQPGDYPRHVLYWLPAMGVPAKHYLSLAEAFAVHGVAVVLHEWRGAGSSDRRASRRGDWGYRELLEADVPAGIEEAKSRWPQAKIWLGGHSLGGQLSCLYASLHPDVFAGLALIASGAPYWRCFPRGVSILLAYLLASPLACLMGYLPGRRIGFGGNEARGVIADWSRSGRTGRYVIHGMQVDFGRQMAALRLPVMALRLSDDWLVPSRSLEWLFGFMPNAPRQVRLVTSAQVAGQRADHFTWMKVPDALAAQLVEWMDRSVAVRSRHSEQA